MESNRMISALLHRTRALLITLSMVIGISVATPSLASAQCPMCKAAVTSEHGTEKNELASGLNTGILYLFALPYGALVVIVASVMISRRRMRNSKLKANAHATATH